MSGEVEEGIPARLADGATDYRGTVAVGLNGLQTLLDRAGSVSVTYKGSKSSRDGDEPVVGARGWVFARHVVPGQSTCHEIAKAQSDLAVATGSGEDEVDTWTSFSGDVGFCTRAPREDRQDSDRRADPR